MQYRGSPEDPPCDERGASIPLIILIYMVFFKITFVERNAFIPKFCPLLKTCKSTFCESCFKTTSAAFIHALLLAKRLPRNDFLNSGSSQRWHEVRSGMFGEWCGEISTYSAAKRPVSNEQYVVGHCHGAIGSHFEAIGVSF
ncbi:hypothetical protein TNCV_2268211 [Trichonephila clavipes]|nr:hypothetical protein TNCV_2268211 [Trichonephila clavipes]